MTQNDPRLNPVFVSVFFKKGCLFSVHHWSNAGRAYKKDLQGSVARDQSSVGGSVVTAMRRVLLSIAEGSSEQPAIHRALTKAKTPSPRPRRGLPIFGIVFIEAKDIIDLSGAQLGFRILN